MKEQTFSMILRRSLPAVYVLAALLTLVVIYTGYSTTKKIQETISHQFNQQQLILARKISDQIQNQISHLQISLLGLKNISKLEGAGIETLADKIFLPNKKLLGGDVLAILYLDQEGKIISRIQDPGWNPEEIPLAKPEALAPYLLTPLLSNRVWMGSTLLLDGRWVLPLGVPVSRKIKGKGSRSGGPVLYTGCHSHCPKSYRRGNFREDRLCLDHQPRGHPPGSSRKGLYWQKYFCRPQGQKSKAVLSKNR